MKQITLLKRNMKLLAGLGTYGFCTERDKAVVNHYQSWFVACCRTKVGLHSIFITYPDKLA